MILDYAKVRGLRSGENPAAWRSNLALMLPAPARVHRVTHHAALPAADMAAVLCTLAKREGVSALAVQFVALTACRASEALGATWGEIDLRQGVWTIPAGRIKAGRVHRVPLSTEAIAILSASRPSKEEIATRVVISMLCALFPGQRRGRPLSLTSLMKAWRSCGGGRTTVHGMRSAFRDWCGEQGEDRELAEIALAHAIGDATEQAYARSDLLERRRGLMQRWADHLAGR